jgi:hypothetical protein
VFFAGPLIAVWPSDPRSNPSPLVTVMWIRDRLSVIARSC